MKKLKLSQKNFIMPALATFMLLSPFSAHASELATPLQQETQAGISPLWVYDYVETIQVPFTTASYPQDYPYEYYHNTFGWMRGVLKYQSHTIDSKGRYIVTYSGRMYSNPL